MVVNTGFCAGFCWLEKRNAANSLDFDENVPGMRIIKCILKSQNFFRLEMPSITSKNGGI